jgi:hypothetical protein
MTEQDKKKFKTVPAMDMDEYKQKIREHRLKILKRTLVTALIVFVIIAGLFLFLALRHYEDFDVNSTVERSDTAATIFEEFQGNILKYSNDGALYTDTYNERIWNQTYEMAKPTIDMCEDYLVIYDKKGTQIYIMTSQGLVSNIETTMTIEQVSIAAQGTVAVLMGDQSNSYLVVYDKNGKELVNGAIYGEDGGYPIAIALSNDAIKLAVSMLDINDGNVKTTNSRIYKRVTLNVLLDSSRVDEIQSFLEEYSLTPMLFIGVEKESMDMNSLTAYGFYKDFDQPIGLNLSQYQIEIEGIV